MAEVILPDLFIIFKKISEMKNIFLAFSILSVLIFQSCLKDDETPVPVAPSEGAIVNPEIGGAAEPNQVWIDLSTGESTITKRTKWDLGFYSGDEFKVILNTSCLMAAGKIDGATNIDAVTESSVADLMTKVQVANFVPTNTIYVDDVTGHYNTGYTAIAEISENDSENGVYLVNMGKETYTGEIPDGSVITGGDSRGWMKVQIVRNGNGYKIKYARLNETTHHEYIISKKPDYNFAFFSMVNQSEVDVQPEKTKWDICFTVFVNIIEGSGTYIYSDFVIDNVLAGASAYEIIITDGSSATEAYNNFKLEDVDASKFQQDQRTIGGNWRTLGPGGGSMNGNRFYILKDPDGLYFKIKFNKIKSDDGVRGHPEFEYKPL